MDYTNYTEKFHELYENAKELVDKNILEIGVKLDAVSENDEKEFYLYLLDFFLQKRQNEVISRELF
ncbi:MAG: hypothetical protein LBL80_02295 [Ruminococcus sp.]|jgi:hypothetical protein|nr:hypothetical protein [Ruminococcus sp.]